MLRLKFAFLFSLIGLLVTSCTPEEDWSTVEYVQYRLELSDPEAFRRLEHLEDAEQATLVPTLIDVFNSGLRKEESLRALVSIGDARAKDIFLSGLQATDDALAALAARGLANLGDSSSATAVAQRLAQVTQHEAYAGFLDALKQIPTPQAMGVSSDTWHGTCASAATCVTASSIGSGPHATIRRPEAGSASTSRNTSVTRP